MLLAVMGVTGAFIFYTLAIWSEKIGGSLKKWIIIIFSCGFLSDLLGTAQMRLIADNHNLTWHSMAGYLALVIMLVHLIWALLAYQKGKSNGKYRHYFHKCSVYAWYGWLVAYMSGIPWGFLI